MTNPIQIINKNPNSNNADLTELNRGISDLASQLEDKAITPKRERLKIMFVGNSYVPVSTGQLHYIAASAGVDITVGNLLLDSSSLEAHHYRIQENLGGYSYRKFIATDGAASLTPYENSKTFDHGLDDEAWDIVVLQQVSPTSGKYETFQPYLNDIIAYIKSNAKNPMVKIALHQTWAYSSDYTTHAGFANYGYNQNQMYEAIVDTYQKAMEESDVDFLIPSGTAIQNARTSSYLLAIGRELTDDGMHLGSIGGFISGLTMFETLIAKKCGIDIFSDVTYIPSGGTRFLAHLAKIAAENARIKPFNITEM